jgi:hypothetical protein
MVSIGGISIGRTSSAGLDQTLPASDAVRTILARVALVKYLRAVTPTQHVKAFRQRRPVTQSHQQETFVPVV